MNDYFLRIVRLPRRVEGVTVVNNDGTFSIYLNELLSEEERRETLDHELRHIRLEHFYNEVPLLNAENAADKDPITIEEAKAAGYILEFPDLQSLKRYYDRLKESEQYG